MNIFRTCFATLIIATLSTSVSFAITIVECVDAEGNSSFRDECPPGTTKKGEKKLLGVGSSKVLSAEEIAKSHPVTLYSVPECDACDLVRSQLETREIPYSEVDVSTDVELQTRLMDAAGSVTVPTVVLGEEVFKGYERTALEAGLTEAGYQ